MSTSLPAGSDCLWNAATCTPESQCDRCAALTQRINADIAASPPLTATQREHLASILHNSRTARAPRAA